MKDRLISYVDLLFAGNPEAQDIKQEILQNTLDRYEDLLASGKTPEAAYSLAISGIGDLSELLNGNQPYAAAAAEMPRESEEEKKKKKLLRSIAVGLYILCAVPLFLFPGQVGLSLLLVIVAIATVLMIFSSQNEKEKQRQQEAMSPQKKLQSSIHSAVWAVGLAVYFIVSFTTGAWYLTWLIFPLVGAVNGLITAIMDLKEAK